MNVRCIKDNCDMVPHDDNVFICLACENKVQVEPDGRTLLEAQGILGHENTWTILNSVDVDVPEGVKEYNDV